MEFYWAWLAIFVFPNRQPTKWQEPINENIAGHANEWVQAFGFDKLHIYNIYRPKQIAIGVYLI